MGKISQIVNLLNSLKLVNFTDFETNNKPSIKQKLGVLDLASLASFCTLLYFINDHVRIKL